MEIKQDRDVEQAVMEDALLKQEEDERTNDARNVSGAVRRVHLSMIWILMRLTLKLSMQPNLFYL